MKRVVWAASATRDLESIRLQLSDFDPVIVQDTVDRLIDAAFWLTDFPGTGPIVGYRGWRKWRARKTRHLLIYQPMRDGIHVVRLFHAQQNWRGAID